tara:strand:+ start:63 stop:743 length:681 start_codon:yes stop_codon:yes gene_type:complete
MEHFRHSMEPYRHALYRYSTGQGFNVNVNVPQKTNEVASYKMIPLYTPQMKEEFAVDIKREADRVSMQYESAMQQLKVLGYDAEAGSRTKDLKIRVEVIKHLMTTYPIRYIKREDLDKLYKLYKTNAPGMQAIIKKTVDQNRNVHGIDDFIQTAMKVRKGYPLYDGFGRKLTKKAKEKFEKAESVAEQGLSGYGEEEATSPLKWIVIALVLGALYKAYTKNKATTA